MAAADEFGLVAGSLSRALRAIRQEATALLTRGAGPGEALAGHIELLCDAVEAHLTQRRQDFAASADPAVQEAAVLELQELLGKVRHLQVVGWLRAAESSPLDLGTRYFVESVARRVVSADVEVTVAATDDRSYSTTSDPFAPAISAWGAGIPAGSATVAIVSIPQREERSGLLHPLIIHELGHTVDDVHDTIDGVVVRARGEAVFEATFQSTANAVAASLQVSPQEAADWLDERLRGWCTEVFCDLLATLILGPTYLYAFAGEVVSENIEVPAEDHPPPRARVTFMLDALDRLGWQQTMADADSAVDAWLRRFAGVACRCAGPYDYLMTAVTSRNGAIYDAATNALQGSPFVPGEQLEKVSELLENGIPPAQLPGGEAAPREAIIFAGWKVAIREAGGGPGGLALAPARAELAELLPAALELAALTEAWTA